MRHAIGVTPETPGGTGKNLDRCPRVGSDAECPLVGIRTTRISPERRGKASNSAISKTK
jgi:hypothetical protein